MNGIPGSRLGDIVERARSLRREEHHRLVLRVQLRMRRNYNGLPSKGRPG
jgi:hypothetical protein